MAALDRVMRLDVRDLSFAWTPGRPVLHGVTFQASAGETLAVVGPNGAGKSTLLKVLSGLLAPVEGRVLLDGEDVHRMDRRAAARTISGVGAEEEATFPFTVRETVELGRHPWRGAFGPLGAEDEARIGSALQVADLAALADRPLPRLSSGERQRARLARCLVQEGDLVLLDEPTTHLDLGHRQRLLGAFRRRAVARGQIVLAVLHDLNLAAAFADRILFLVDGRVEILGTPREVLTAERIAEALGARIRVMGGERPTLVLEGGIGEGA